MKPCASWPDAKFHPQTNHRMNGSHVECLHLHVPPGWEAFCHRRAYLSTHPNYQPRTQPQTRSCISSAHSSSLAKSPSRQVPLRELPTPTPTLPPLPDNALITGLEGQRQSLPLDCESRSAVDWARFFNVHIDEIDFFNNLPKSDHPDLGFVGSVYGAWGQIPPDPYGVHAKPVADLLQEYGLSAYSHRPLSWDNLRLEIASGRPVIVWVLGNIDQGNYEYIVNGIPVYYFPPEETLTIVARYEHTVIVTGYTPSSVTFLNGATSSERSLIQFLESWSALGNMAITTQP